MKNHSDQRSGIRCPVRIEKFWTANEIDFFNEQGFSNKTPYFNGFQILWSTLAIFLSIRSLLYSWSQSLGVVRRIDGPRIWVPLLLTQKQECILEVWLFSFNDRPYNCSNIRKLWQMISP